jgi:hypothetical protein
MASHEDEEALVSDSQRKKVFCPGCAARFLLSKVARL